jgi:hypothetical protein
MLAQTNHPRADWEADEKTPTPSEHGKGQGKRRNQYNGNKLINKNNNNLPIWDHAPCAEHRTSCLSPFWPNSKEIRTAKMNHKPKKLRATGDKIIVQLPLKIQYQINSIEKSLIS